MRDRKEKCLVVAFLALPLTLLLAILLTPDRGVSVMENRSLVTRGDIHADVSGGQFQRDLENYLSDQFPLRDRVQQAAAALRFFSGSQEMEGTYIGKNGRLFQKYTPASVDTEACEKYARRINRLAENTGLPTYYLPVPSAGIALRQELPYGAPMYDYRALWNALARQMPSVRMMDPLPVLAEDTDAYYVSDHHWTAHGVCRAYGVWCDAHGTRPSVSESDFVTVSDRFHGTLYSRVPSGSVPFDSIRALPPDETWSVEADGTPIGMYDPAALRTKDKYNYFQGGNHGLVTVTNPHSASDRTLLLLKDSFANSLLPCLARDYAKIVMLDERYAFVSAAELAPMVGADEIAVVREILSVP